MNWEELYQHPLASALRAVFFQTEYTEYPHATHGGTLFIVKYGRRPYGVTCKHVLGDFDPNMLHVSARTELRPGQLSARIKNLGFANNLGGAAVGSDLGDLCIIEFADDLAPDFFGGTAYPIENKTVGSSAAEHDLFAIGISKDRSRLLPDGNFALCMLPLRDRGPTSDTLLRRASARYGEADFETITGMSGAPVFNLTKQVLCGMVMRGGFRDGLCEVRYLDVWHIIQLIHAIHVRALGAFYYS
ncbi:hypothetical protein N2603_06750 [Bradyrhizobium huanghuaihaiense]|uniref:hypothetical protein n=1 Tax=Bradyrhizobium huanghuaihaiense TaxID=990078 RepID=UPI0021A9A316|nr:hypothetical protein [Bradyrhizobium sp. CB3035]UWU78153.1 hypothetical protein N2603_06750 [Bradyrhizobium sp. CB3035]